MKRLLLAVLVAVLTWLPATAAAAPVDLLEADTQAFLQDSGAMDVIYSLRFRDNEGRGFIRQIGPVDEPVHFTRGWLKQGEQSDEVTTTLGSAVVP